MHEYVAQAVILDKEPFRETDSRVSFFTEKFGKLTGKVISTRKITSKLAGHFEPGNFVNLRFVEKKNLQIVDGIKSGQVRVGQPDLYRLHQILPEGQPENNLWSLFKENKFNWREALKILGWDPKESACANCGKSPNLFYIPRQELFCKNCSLNFPQSELIIF